MSREGAARRIAAAQADPDDFGPRLGRGAVMSLYCAPADPLGHAVRVVLAEKAVSVDLFSSDEKPEDVLARDPYDSSLALVDRDLVLYEVQIVLEYLDERFPHPPLMPVDPVARANGRLFRHRFQHDLYGLVGTIEGGARGQAERARKQLRDHLTAISQIFERGRFFMSDEYSLVDCCLAPVLWRLPHLGVKLPPARSRGLLAYAERLFEREAFERSLTELEEEMR